MTKGRIGVTIAAGLLVAATSAMPCTTDPDCADGDVCNGTELCVAGVCQPGTALSCDDLNAATTDSCDPVGGCRHDAPITTKRLALRAAPTNPAKQAIKLTTSASITVSNPGFAGGSSDPTLHGATLRVKAGSGEFDVTYNLPASNWTYLGADPVANRGYWYKDKNQVLGPIRFVSIRDGVVTRAYGTGPGLGITMAQNPQPVDVVLTLGVPSSGGATSYCMEAGGTTSYVQDLRFRAKSALAPVACP